MQRIFHKGQQAASTQGFTKYSTSQKHIFYSYCTNQPFLVLFSKWPLPLLLSWNQIGFHSVSECNTKRRARNSSGIIAVSLFPFQIKRIALSILQMQWVTLLLKKLLPFDSPTTKNVAYMCMPVVPLWNKTYDEASSCKTSYFKYLCRKMIQKSPTQELFHVCMCHFVFYVFYTTLMNRSTWH